jgi:hypothetical protein
LRREINWKTLAGLADYELSSYRGESLLSTINAHFFTKIYMKHAVWFIPEQKYWGGYLNFDVWFMKIIFFRTKR